MRYSARPGHTGGIFSRPAALAAVVLMVAVCGYMALVVVPSSLSTTYTVKPDDTLSELAYELGVPVDELAAANNLESPDDIHLGQVLVVPGRGPIAQLVSRVDALSALVNRDGGSEADTATQSEISGPEAAADGQSKHPANAAQPAYPHLPESILNDAERLQLVPDFEMWAAEYEVPIDLLMAISYQESGWQAGALSHKGAIGVGQLMPETASWVASHLLEKSDLDPDNPQDNIQMSARFLAWLITISPDEQTAIAGYYQGPSSVAQQGLYDDTEDYVANVQGARNLFVQA